MLPYLRMASRICRPSLTRRATGFSSAGLACSGWVLLAFLVAACGRDPILKRAEELEDRPSQGGQATRIEPQAGAPTPPLPGMPEAPPLGQTADAPPGASASPPPGEPSAESGTGPALDGLSVTLQGEIQLDDYELGGVRIDVFDGDQKVLQGPRPAVVAVAKLDRPGPFSIQIPASATQVWLGAYVDEDLNGRPGPQDPAGWYLGNPIETDGGVTGINIVLTRQPPPTQSGL